MKPFKEQYYFHVSEWIFHFTTLVSAIRLSQILYYYFVFLLFAVVKISKSLELGKIWKYKETPLWI